jgi:hypothetical protein
MVTNLQMATSGPTPPPTLLFVVVAVRVASANMDVAVAAAVVPLVVHLNTLPTTTTPDHLLRALVVLQMVDLVARSASGLDT